LGNSQEDRQYLVLEEQVRIKANAREYFNPGCAPDDLDDFLGKTGRILSLDHVIGVQFPSNENPLYFPSAALEKVETEPEFQVGQPDRLPDEPTFPNPQGATRESWEALWRLRKTDPVVNHGLLLHERYPGEYPSEEVLIRIILALAG